MTLVTIRLDIVKRRYFRHSAGSFDAHSLGDAHSRISMIQRLPNEWRLNRRPSFAVGGQPMNSVVHKQNLLFDQNALQETSTKEFSSILQSPLSNGI